MMKSHANLTIQRKAIEQYFSVDFPDLGVFENQSPFVLSIFDFNFQLTNTISDRFCNWQKSME